MKIEIQGARGGSPEEKLNGEGGGARGPGNPLPYI